VRIEPVTHSDTLQRVSKPSQPASARRLPAWRATLEPFLDDLRAFGATRDRRAQEGVANAPFGMRYLVVAEPGNGEEQLVGRLASEMFSLGITSSAIVSRMPIDSFLDSLTGFKVGGSSAPNAAHEGVPDEVPGSIWMVDGYSADADGPGAQGQPALIDLLRRAAHAAGTLPSFTIPLVLVISPSTLAEFDQDPDLRYMFSRRIEVPRATAEDLADEIVYLLEERSFVVPSKTRKALVDECAINSRVSFELTPGIADEIVFAHGQRIAGNGTKKSLAEVTRGDIVLPNPQSKDVKSFEEVMSEFDDLVGMEGIRDYLDGIAALAITRRNNAAAGRPLGNQLDHFVFTGPPGTGKTTVARKIGEVFASIGMIESGHVVSRDRSTLVGKYVGHSESLMREAVEQAKHGVLFIDEAYGLADNANGGMDAGSNSTDSRNFGALALQRLLTAMTDPDCQPFICVVAGYTDEMDWFLQSNPGLTSRFTARLDFEPYSDEVLGEIFTRHAEERHLDVGADARRAAMGVLAEARRSAGSNFGNAREAMNLVEKAIQEASQRAVKLDGEEAVVSEITADDIRSARSAIGLDLNPDDNDATAVEDRVITPILERAEARIDAQDSWSEGARQALKENLKRVRRGEMMGFASSLPRTVSDILVADSSGVDLASLIEILSEFYVSLGALRSGKPLAIERDLRSSEEDLVAYLDEFYSSAKGRCVVINSLEAWLPKAGTKAKSIDQPLMALAAGLRRNRNNLLLIAKASLVPDSGRPEVSALLDEFELKLV